MPADWLRGSELGPEELRALGEVTLALLQRLDATHAPDETDVDDLDAAVTAYLLDTPLLSVLQDAVERLSTQAHVAARRSAQPRVRPTVTLADLAESLTYTDGVTPDAQEERVRFALLLDPTCVDALTQLGWFAEEASEWDVAEQRYTQAVAAATARLEPGRLSGSHKNDDFWLGTEQRPYMRAQAALAQLYRKTGRMHEAVALYRELLRLAPYDGQGNRYGLIGALIENRDYAGAQRVLDKHCRDEGDADALWPRALVAFALHGAGHTAETALALALQQNPHVPAYLLGPEPPPWHPTHYSHGSVEEALCYVARERRSWIGTPGALAWLDQQAGQGWRERQETETALARVTLSPDHRLLTHYRAVRALAELAEQQPGEDMALLCVAPAAVIARFWRTLTATERGCWIWTGSSVMRHKGQQATLLPAPLAWAIVNGRALPPTAQLVAFCGTPYCVNPRHGHLCEVLTREGIATELEARLGGRRSLEDCRALVWRALHRSGYGEGLQDHAIPQPEQGGPLVRRELVDPWLEKQVRRTSS